MHDVREALRLEEPLDLHRPGDTDAREVVAAEVDEHDVLGAVLLGGEQPLGVALSGLGRAGDRIQGGARALALDERLRRRADQGQPVELEQEEIRRRVDGAQRAVERDRGRRSRTFCSLREHDLEGVADPDVLLADLDPALILGLRRVAGGRRSGHGLARGTLHVGLEQARDLRRVAVEHLRDASAVIEAHEDVGDHEAALRQPATGNRQWHGRLELCDEVVGEVPDDRLARLLGLLVGDQARAAADEGVAPEPAALDRLEQEARPPGRAQLQVGPERGEEIGVENG